MSGSPYPHPVLSGELNALIQDLYAGALHVPTADYQCWAVRQVQGLLPGTRWTWGVAEIGQAHLHAGVVLTGASASANDVCSAAGSCVASPLDPAQLTFREQRSGLDHVVSIARRAPDRMFSGRERSLLAAIGPHLFAAWLHARLAGLTAHALASASQAAALVDRRGLVHGTQGRFFALVRQTWPQWNSGALPGPLIACLERNGEHIVAGVRWTVALAETDDAIRIAATPLSQAAQRLSSRERSVANWILAGATYSVAAERLGISVNTLRNTLVRVYRKLGVRNKLELARRLEFA